MNFFEHQDRARGTTQKLVLLFGLAVASLIFITTLLVVFVLGFANQAQTPGAVFSTTLHGTQVFVGVTAVVVGVVLLGAFFRMAQLRGGGRVVAESLGGRLLNPGSSDADERRILNVVEEIAIAAGVPVPPVYLLEDPAINAFAAGFRQEDAVIGITRGCIHLLNRDELQGVIAHEFSHIFNGDMRLNIRLIGWLYGIMVIGMIGYFMLRGSRYGWSTSRRKNGGGILFLALGLVVVGYGGTFFGNLIKAAVSRQREFLADASAVQYTRNPEGIAGALKKIAAHSEGSQLQVDVSEVSHMLFGQGIKAGFTGLFATHPPLAERIRRIQPRWDGSLPAASAPLGAVPASQTAAGSATEPDHAAPASLDVLAATLVAAVGEPAAAHVAQAAEDLAGVSPDLRRELGDPLGASLLMHALLLKPQASQQSEQSVSPQGAIYAEQRQEQLRQLRAALPTLVLEQLEAAQVLLQQVRRGQLLTLVELAVPALKRMSPEQQRSFLHIQQMLIASDGDVDLFEWCVSRLLRQQLAPAPLQDVRQVQLEHCTAASSLLLSALCHAGQDELAEVNAAFAAGKAVLALPLAQLPAGSALDARKLDMALRQLQALKPLQKPRLLKAMVACVSNDGRLQAAEGELLRVTALLLDCPMPPLPRGLLAAGQAGANTTA
jgi:Zn-dependent protease with chaperone function